MRTALLTPFLFLPLFAGCSSEPAQAKGNPLEPPKGLEQAQLATAPDNPLTEAKAELGKLLFFDPRLSGSGKMGCVDCHYPDKKFTDGIAHSTKDDGKQNTRNSPTVYNVGYLEELYWDGRAKGLEANVKAAWTGQLAGNPEAVAAKLNAVDAYKQKFEQAFQKPADEQTIVFALASFLRTLRTGNSAYDRFQAGDESALSEQAKQGYELFRGKAGCIVCHVPPLFTDRNYHNVGIGSTAENPDTGRAKATKADADTGKFKTPSLREVAHTAPYFHDGSTAALRDAVETMASGGIANPNKDPLLLDRQLADEEIDQLVAFLQSLSGDVAWTAPVLPK